MSTEKSVYEKQEGLYKELTYKIIGALYEVHNELGSVHKENIYHKAIAVELKNRKIGFEEEKFLPVEYKGQKVGSYKPDFIIEDKVILELKAVPILTKAMFDQIFYYIKGTDYKLVLLANFGTAKLTIKRRIYT
jgi:GxxExxY protein